MPHTEFRFQHGGRMKRTNRNVNHPQVTSWKGHEALAHSAGEKEGRAEKTKDRKAKKGNKGVHGVM